MAGLMAEYLLTSWIPAFAGMTRLRGGNDGL